MVSKLEANTNEINNTLKGGKKQRQSVQKQR